MDSGLIISGFLLSHLVTSVVNSLRYGLTDDEIAILHVVIKQRLRLFWIALKEQKVQHEIGQFTFAIFVNWIRGKVSEEAAEAFTPEYLDVALNLAMKLLIITSDKFMRIPR